MADPPPPRGRRLAGDGWERLDRIELDDTEVVVTAKPVQVSKEDRSTPTAGDDEELALRRRKGADTTTVQCIGPRLPPRGGGVHFADWLLAVSGVNTSPPGSCLGEKICT